MSVVNQEKNITNFENWFNNQLGISTPNTDIKETPAYPIVRDSGSDFITRPTKGMIEKQKNEKKLKEFDKFIGSQISLDPFRI